MTFAQTYLTAVTCLLLGAIHGTSRAAAPQVPQLTPGKAYEHFEDFKALRANMLDLIGTSKKRVILISEFLSDGDISSALYLAKYRKVKVNVLLSKRKANRYLSRVRDLKRQGISVSHRPRRLPLTDPTLLLIDNRLYRISRDLNVLRPDIAATMTQVHPKIVHNFLDALIKAFKNRKGFKTTPLPKVGRPRRSKSVSRNYRKPYQRPSDGSYDYDRHRPPSRPKNVPLRLPKSTVYQNNQRRKILEQERLKKLEEEKKKMPEITDELFEENNNNVNSNDNDTFNDQVLEELNDQL